MKNSYTKTKITHILLGLTIVCLTIACKKDSPFESFANLDEAYDAFRTELNGLYPKDNSFILDENSPLRNSRLYEFCEKMPKGSNLHVHCDALIPTSMLIDYVQDHPELKVSIIRDDKFGTIVHCPDDKDIPHGYVSMDQALQSGCTRKDFRNAWTVLGCGNKRTWDWFEGIFDKMVNVTASLALLEDYYTRSFKYYVGQGVSHIEIRKLFFGDNAYALEQARAIYRAQNEARKLNPDFSVGIIICGLKAKTETYDKSVYDDMLFDNGVYASLNIRDTLANMSDFIVGLDLVNEEDISLPLMGFHSILENAKAKNPALHITLHAGESLNPDNNEIAAAISLRCERIGHGFNLYMHPELKQEVIKKGIMLECCPISNSVLGYCPDLANHPAPTYMKEGIKVALCDDDPSYLMNSSLVDDYFVSILKWNLPLSQLKQLFRNSIEGAFMSESRKQQLLKAWEKQWADFEKEILNQ